MQFKHPEILYVLFALLIPVFIHLFQLQKFTRTPFTNIKFLKEIEFQTRKSSRLKKWLVLLSRLCIFAALIFAFAQPFSSKNDTSKDWLTSIYLDNSMSMQTKGERGALLQRAVQEIAEYVPDNGIYTLHTNNQSYQNLTKKILVEELKNIEFSPAKTNLKTILLKAAQNFEKNPNLNHKLLLVSDFQYNKSDFDQWTESDWRLFSDENELDFVQLHPKFDSNIGIDSVYVIEKNTDNTLLEISLTNEGETQQKISVSALQNEIVLAKNTLDIPKNSLQKTTLRVPNRIDNISIHINSEDAYLFDNIYYISFQQPEIIDILEIGENKSFLSKIYTLDEFNYTQKTVNEISFDLLEKQETILLNNLEKLPQQFAPKLLDFVEKGGNLAVIPHKNNSLDDLNVFFNSLKLGQLTNKFSDSLLVTKIHFAHPLLKGVFDKKIANFQYPSVTTRFEGTFANNKNILSFENQRAFISEIPKGKGNIYWISGALDSKSSNFTNAPLIVPIFYNIGKMSSMQTDLAYRIGDEHKIEVAAALQKDEVLHIVGQGQDFIPMQRLQPEKVSILTQDQPDNAGFYKIMNKEINLGSIAFNHALNENKLSFIDFAKFNETAQNWQQFPTIKKALENLTVEQHAQSYFKWFILLAFIFLLIEILLLKYL